METMENVNAIVEEVASEEMKEAVIATAEEIVAESSGSVLGKIGKASVVVAGIAGIAYAGYKFVVKPIKKKLDERKAAIEAVEGDVDFDDYFEEEGDVDTSKSEETEE